MILFHTPEASNWCILILCPHEIHSSNEEKCRCIHISYGFCIMTWVNWRLSLLRESHCQCGVSNQVSEVHIACWTLPKGRGFSKLFLSEIRKSRIFLRRLRKIKEFSNKILKLRAVGQRCKGEAGSCLCLHGDGNLQGTYWTYADLGVCWYRDISLWWVSHQMTETSVHTVWPLNTYTGQCLELNQVKEMRWFSLSHSSWYPKGGLWTKSMGITRELVRKMSGPLFDPLKQNLHLNKISGWFICTLMIDRHCLRQWFPTLAAHTNLESFSQIQTPGPHFIPNKGGGRTPEILMYTVALMRTTVSRDISDSTVTSYPVTDECI